MTTFTNPNDQYYGDSSNRSPPSFRNQAMNRQGNGGMGFGTMPGGFGAENAARAFSTGRGDVFGGQYSNMSAGNPNFAYDQSLAQTWNAPNPPLPSFAGSNMNGNYGPARGLKPNRGRLPVNEYFDQQQHHGMLPPGRNPLAPQPSRGLGQSAPEDDEELIPTAIVIKNIPFAVKKEQLVQLMVDMNLPLPYAFNYHFDNGVFRGLAFANFTSPDETEQVIGALNHMELSGRKLRVEYKKMLPLAERERIEREKRERRGQLEEQHRPIGPATQLHTQLSVSSMSRNTPSPLSHRPANGKPDVDMNHPKTLDLYTDMMLFRRDASREVLIFPPSLPPHERRIVHTLAHHMGLQHTSRGTGEQRQVHIYRPAPGTNTSPPTMSGGFSAEEGFRQPLTRTSTSDFGEGRTYEPTSYHNNILRGQASVGLLDVGDSYGRASDSNLRNAKSFADLRSWSPSPAASSASFTAALQTNGARLQAQAQGLNDTAGSGTPTLTPTATSGVGRDEPSFLISGMSNMGLNNVQTSPRRQRMFGSDSPWGDSYAATAPIGSKRTASAGPEGVPLRQSRGPGPNNTVGFRRQNGRSGSDELRQNSIAE